MAERRGFLSRWRCARMRASLVDCADGELDAAARARVERHAAECGECRDVLAALREVAPALRRVPAPQRDEHFFRRQRQSILRRVRQAPPLRVAPPFRPRFGWMAGLAIAALVALVLLRRPPEAPVVVPPGAVSESLSADELADLTLSGDADLVDSAALGDELLAFGEAPLGDGEEWAPEPDVGDLNDQELERLEEIIG